MERLPVDIVVSIPGSEVVAILSGVVALITVASASSAAMTMVSRLQLSADCAGEKRAVVNTAYLASVIPLRGLEASSRVLVAINCIAAVALLIARVVRMVRQDLLRSVSTATAALLLYFAESDVGNGLSGVLEHGSIVDVVLGIVGLLIFALVSSRALLCVIRLPVRRVDYDFIDSSSDVLKWLVGRETYTYDCDADDDNSKQMYDHYISLCRGYRLEWLRFFSVELIMIVVQGVAMGAVQTACVVASWCSVGVMTCYTLVLVVTRPFKYTVAQLMIPLISALIVLHLTMQLVVGATSDAALIFQYAALCCAGLFSLINVGLELWLESNVILDCVDDTQHVELKSETTSTSTSTVT